MIDLAALLIASMFPAAERPGPQLFFRTEDIQTFRTRIEEQGPFRDAWEHIQRRADGFLEARFIPEAEAEKGAGQHGNYYAPAGQMRDLGRTLGFAWGITGQRPYAEKLRDAMLFYARYVRWTGKAFSTWDPPWRSELTTSKFLLGYATGYDFLRGSLQPEDRRTIVDAMIRLGIRPTVQDWLGPQGRVHALDSMGHNWWSVCVAAAGIAALAIEKDFPEARIWADRVAAAFPKWFAYKGNILQNKMPTFDRTGGFYESVGYTDYALRYFYLFRMAYRNARGTRSTMLDKIPELTGIPEFLLHTAYPTRDGFLTVNFGDQSIDSPVSGVTALSAARDAEADVAAALRWYYARAAGGPRNMFEILLFDPKASADPPTSLPLSRYWPDMGWAVLRDSWDLDATLLAVKCGDTWNHAHADAGSFILWTAGQLVLIDSGTCSYGRREYTGYYCQSQAHNVVLLDGQGQPPEDLYRGSKFRGRIPVFLGSGPGRLRLLLADATGPTAHLFSRNYRTVLWAGRVILMIDELRSHRPGRFEWLVHHEGEAQVSNEAQRVAVTTEAGGVRVETIWPKDVAYERRRGLRDHKPDEKMSYLAVVTPEPSREAKFLTALVPHPQPEKDTLAFERLSGEHFLGAAWQEAGLRTEVYLNLRADGSRMHRNSNAMIGPWLTDAYLLVIQTPSEPQSARADNVQRFAVVSGSYLRTKDRILLDSLAKTHTIKEPNP